MRRAMGAFLLIEQIALIPMSKAMTIPSTEPVLECVPRHRKHHPRHTLIIKKAQSDPFQHRPDVFEEKEQMEWMSRRGHHVVARIEGFRLHVHGVDQERATPD